MRAVLHGVSVPLEKVNWIAERAQEPKFIVYEPGNGRDAAVLGLGHRVEDLVLLKIACILVVLAMRNAPRMKRDENERVQDMAEEGIDALIPGEGPVATVVT